MHKAALDPRIYGIYLKVSILQTFLGDRLQRWLTSTAAPWLSWRFGYGHRGCP